MAIQYLDDGRTDGSVLGNTTAGTIPKVAFFGAAPVVQPATTGNTTTTAAGSVTTVFTNTTFAGGVGTTAYTVGDLVAALKNVGLLKL